MKDARIGEKKLLGSGRRGLTRGIGWLVLLSAASSFTCRLRNQIFRSCRCALAVTFFSFSDARFFRTSPASAPSHGSPIKRNEARQLNVLAGRRRVRASSGHSYPDSKPEPCSSASEPLAREGRSPRPRGTRSLPQGWRFRRRSRSLGCR